MYIIFQYYLKKKFNIEGNEPSKTFVLYNITFKNELNSHKFASSHLSSVPQPYKFKLNHINSRSQIVYCVVLRRHQRDKRQAEWFGLSG